LYADWGGIEMKKFECTLEAKIEVKFSDESKVEAFFIDGDWKKSFYDLGDMEELASHLVYAFDQTPEEWSDRGCSSKFIEGFGAFYEVSRGTWIITSKETGDIIIEEIEDLYVSWVDEV
jgi:hypothetical protein